MNPVTGGVGDRMHAARKRPPAVVGLDLRFPGRISAVAVDRRGTLLAWALLDGEGDPAALARRAVRELAVRPTAVSVLLGAGAAGTGGAVEAQVAFLSHSEAPDEKEVQAALFAEGYERVAEPATAALAVSPGVWLVAACSAGAIEPLASGLLEESGALPVFAVDQLWTIEGLPAGTAWIELGETGLLVAAAPPGAPPFLRFLPGSLDPGEAVREIRESLEAAGLGGSWGGAVPVRGTERDSLAPLLAERGVPAVAEPLPALGGESLPPACELAWRLALRPPKAALTSARSEKRRASLVWAQRATRLALGLAAVGALLILVGLQLTWGNRVRNRAVAAHSAGDARMVQELKEIGALAGEVKRLRGELTGQTPPWPHLAEPVAALARQVPPEVGWERFQVKDGGLEIEASAGGATPLARLDLLRLALERSPGIVNLSWTAPVADKESPRFRQTFRATLKDSPFAAPVARGGKTP